MRHLLLLPALLMLSSAFAATDDYKLIKLEQDVRNLERQVQALSREVGELRSQLGRDGGRTAPAPRAAAPTDSFSTVWLSVANWERLRPGMSEMEVIDALGPPTSMRQEGEMRVLLYAMEIGSSGFLSGSVSLRDRAVVEVRKPALK